MLWQKYVILESGQFLIFDESISHDTFRFVKPISAGQIQVLAKDGKLIVSCFGESMTLNLKSRKEIDAKIIKQKLDPD